MQAYFMSWGRVRIRCLSTQLVRDARFHTPNLVLQRFRCKRTQSIAPRSVNLDRSKKCKKITPQNTDTLKRDTLNHLLSLHSMGLDLNTSGFSPRSHGFHCSLLGFFPLKRPGVLEGHACDGRALRQSGPWVSCAGWSFGCGGQNRFGGSYFG